MRYLADDRLCGCLPGTPGYQPSVDYVAAQLKKNSVAPVSDQGGTFDWAAGAKYAQLNFLIGYQVAQAVKRPTWNKGDFSGVRFGR